MRSFKVWKNLRGVRSIGADSSAPARRREPLRVAAVLGALGPGLLTALAGMDAGGVATFSNAGAVFGYEQLWSIPVMCFLLIVVQETAARMGCVTGKGFAALIREQYGVRLSAFAMLALIVSNTAVTLSEFAGIASGMQLFGVPTIISVPIAAIAVWLLGMSGSYKRIEKILLAIGIIGVIGGLVMLGMERSGRRNSARRIVCGRNLLIASVVMTLCMSAISYVGTAPIKGLYVILPVLAVFYLVYHSYSTEFFVITVDSGVALGLMWLAHRALVSSNFVWVAYAALIAAVVLTIAQIFVVNSVRAKQGKSKNTGKKAEAHFSSNAFLMMTVTPIIMTVLTAAVLFAPAHMPVVMGIAAAYLFVTAVYYTVKLM